MKVTEAKALIESGFLEVAPKTTWADLGCGDGIFTKALAQQLGDGSTIYAVDKESQQITSPDVHKVKIEFIKLDFINDKLPFSNLDGVLMANSLHYVKDKSQFIDGVKKHMKSDGQWIIVEYDTERQNPWVPYPISFNNLVKAFVAAGFNQINKIGERKSIYGSAKMYACTIKHHG